MNINGSGGGTRFCFFYSMLAVGDLGRQMYHTNCVVLCCAAGHEFYGASGAYSVHLPLVSSTEYNPQPKLIKFVYG